jgi:hypothetical protein
MTHIDKESYDTLDNIKQKLFDITINMHYFMPMSEQKELDELIKELQDLLNGFMRVD